MNTPRSKRYRRYLEPGETCRIPKQTAFNQRFKLNQQHAEVDAAADIAENEAECTSASTSPSTSASATDSGLAAPSAPNGGAPDKTSLGSASNSATVTNNYPAAPSGASHTAVDETSPGSSSNSTAAEGSIDLEDIDSNASLDQGSSAEESDSAELEGEDCWSPDDSEMRTYLEGCSKETLPNQALTKAQALLLILAYVVQSGLSWTQVECLLVLVNTLCGCDVVPNSKYMFRKLWRDRTNSVNIHFFCCTCLAYLGKKVANGALQAFACATCQVCHTVQDMMRRGNFFLIFDLRRPLWDKMGRHAQQLYNCLTKPLSHTYGVYADITHGRMYTSIRRQLGMKWSDITVTLNSDGSPVFKSTKSSVWPIQLFINELPFNIRFQDVLVGALWFGKQHPPALLFMKAFVEAFNEIGCITWKHAGQTIISRAYAVCCCVDSPARASLLNMKQFNGYFGCSWCLEKGTVVEGTLRYISSQSAAPLRTHRSMLKDMRDAHQRGEPVHGIKGPSPLMKLEGFNLVWCMPPDLMHCVLEGVAKQLLDLWLSATGQPYYIGRCIRDLDGIIVKMKPPISFCRLPRPLSDRANWKATEWLYWLLYYSLPCLKEALPLVYLNHFCMFCQGVFLLLQASITDADLQEAESLLSCFVSRAYTLYGPSSATYNIHQLLHLSKSVEMLGPLWGTSTFPFENGNGQLLKLVTAAQGVPLQIAERCAMKSWLRTALKFVDMCFRLQSNINKMMKIHSLPASKIRVLGAPLLSEQIDSSVAELFIAKFGAIPAITLYSRVQFSGITIHTTSYSRASKTFSSCVKMTNGMYCLVSKICSVLLGSRKILFVCEELVTSDCNFRGVRYMQKCNRPPPGRNLCLYSAGDVSSHCVFLVGADINYVSDIPNNYKID